MRTGIGYDIHRFTRGRPLVLGGIRIPSHCGLDGHSDADVIIHAIADALLGSVAAGDIGQWFPTTDPRYKNMNSGLMLQAIRDYLKKKHVTVINIDTMIIADTPKIAPYAQRMRIRIADMLKIKPHAVSIKATTNEGLGYLGQKKAIAAWAICSVNKKLNK
ncbi:MAG: 2-C-methyl-D-erythritol 2,4-cyclodiphosphate synthase [Elusimicrobia bacterium]|nr:2-C-methyl-D-erythritol 2,4-cyclodiphosphate synthase [Elusimicrobiota bacterium]MBD3411484.1 2-C-methyl-D-erythritol 2,4-cyclodiphosphate synthase [Elusimicrobiota bacterium]